MNFCRSFISAVGLAALAGLGACAAIGPSEANLSKQAGATLGLQPSQFTISDREADGVRTRFNVTTKTGKHYGCYVTGTGPVTSDAICTPTGNGASAKPTAQSHSGTATPSCNALLEAAGKCK